VDGGWGDHRHNERDGEREQDSAHLSPEGRSPDWGRSYHSIRTETIDNVRSGEAQRAGRP
jgi:hypothetical protein